MMMGVVGLKSRANIAYVGLANVENVCVYLATLTLYNNAIHGCRIHCVAANARLARILALRGC